MRQKPGRQIASKAPSAPHHPVLIVKTSCSIHDLSAGGHSLTIARISDHQDCGDGQLFRFFHRDCGVEWARADLATFEPHPDGRRSRARRMLREAQLGKPSPTTGSRRDVVRPPACGHPAGALQRRQARCSKHTTRPPRPGACEPLQATAIRDR